MGTGEIFFLLSCSHPSFVQSETEERQKRDHFDIPLFVHMLSPKEKKRSFVPLQALFEGVAAERYVNKINPKSLNSFVLRVIKRAAGCLGLLAACSRG